MEYWQIVSSLKVPGLRGLRGLLEAMVEGQFRDGFLSLNVLGVNLSPVERMGIFSGHSTPSQLGMGRLRMTFSSAANSTGVLARPSIPGSPGCSEARWKTISSQVPFS